MIDIGAEYSANSFDVIDVLTNHTTYYAGDIKVVTDFDLATLARLGYQGAQLVINPVQQ